MNLLTPASGGPTVASGQVLNRDNLILINEGFTVPYVMTTVLGLPRVYINLFQYPEYNDGTTLHPSRNWIAWRPVLAMPPDVAVPGFPFVVNGSFGGWIPATPPRLLVTGQPNVYELVTGGASLVGIEFDTSAQAPVGNQGRDRVIASISASI